jgi:hypothetical protein
MKEDKFTARPISFHNAVAGKLKSFRLAEFALFILLVGATACNSASSAERAAGAADDLGKRNREVVTAFMNAELKGDVATLSKLMSDDYVEYGLGVNNKATKEQSLKSIKDHWDIYKYGGKRFTAIETSTMTTTTDGGRGRPKGDWVLVWGDLAIDYPAAPDYLNKATTATVPHHTASRVENGKVTTRSLYFNHEGIMRQLGYLMISPAEQQKHKDTKLTLK